MEQSVENEIPQVKKELTKRDVTKSFWRWTFFSHANYNYERLEATGLVHALSPIIKKLYADDSDEYRSALKRHMAFFNTEPHFGGIICGMVIAMEEDRANGAPITDDAINGIKTGLMGPFAGIGDTLWQGTLTPILLAFGVSLGSEGNLMGPLVYGIMMFGIMFSLAYFVWMQGYKMGKTGIEKILSSNILQYLITGASAMGAIVLGALTANFVSVSSPFVIKVGTVKLGLQEDILDKLFKGILPLGITLLTLYLLKNRKMKSTKVMLILVIIGILFGAVNIF